MDKIINLGIPHVGEQIFEGLDADNLMQCLEVSQIWKSLGENVLLKKWEGKMFEACETGKTKIVKLLLENYNCEENGLNATDVFGTTTPFIEACLHGHTDVVKLILDHAQGDIDFNTTDDDFGMTALMWACRIGHKDVVKLLLHHSEEVREKRGQGVIDLDAEDNNQRTAKMHASSNKEIVQLLLDHRSKISIDPSE